LASDGLMMITERMCSLDYAILAVRSKVSDLLWRKDKAVRENFPREQDWRKSHRSASQKGVFRKLVYAANFHRSLKKSVWDATGLHWAFKALFSTARIPQSKT